MGIVVITGNPTENCDKCGRTVPPGNDVVHLLAAGGDPVVLLTNRSRHLLPVTQGTEVVCEGSPSLAQYLEGQPHDSRPQYAYKPEREPVVRKAYDFLQQQCGSR